MDIRQLEVFASVVENKGFLSSAQKLHLSQSTVSTHIAALEKELNTELIRRTTRTFELTPDGERLYIYATDILALQQRALKELSGKSKKVLLIGTSSVPAQCIVPQLLAAFHQRLPEIRYEVVRADSIDIIEKVAAGRLDFGFVGTKTDVPCAFRPIASDELVVATPNTEAYRKQHKGHILPDMLLKSPFLMREETSGTVKETMRFLSGIGISEDDMNIVARIGDAELLRLCIVEGLGISVLSYRTVEDLIRQGRVLAFTLGENAFRRDLYVVYRKIKYLPESAKAFINFSTNFFHKQARSR